jgi:VIT1/CCC1 family predicted Fe2+/Mn2+ transporter
VGRRQSPEGEQAQLVEFYRSQGLSEAEAQAVAIRVMSQLEMRAQYAFGKQLGLTSEVAWPPVKAGLLTGLSFAVASLVPILPFAFLQVTAAALTAALASMAALFGVGASKAIFTRKGWVGSGLEVLAVGVLAATSTYLIGLAFPE